MPLTNEQKRIAAQQDADSKLVIKVTLWLITITYLTALVVHSVNWTPSLLP